jgi:hypothetical protein
MKKLAFFLPLLLISMLPGCQPIPSTGGAAQATANPIATPVPCADPVKAIDGLYAADDAGKYDQAASYLTDDISIVSWIEGVNGRHLQPVMKVGKDQIVELLKKAGMRTQAVSPDLPNYTRDRLVSSPTKVSFMLEPDRKHPDGRPYNPFSVEVFFSGCQIELIKVVERVTWL